MSDTPLLIHRVIRSKRRTIALIVERDGSVTVRAPMKMSGKAIMDFVDGHAHWVEKKQAEIRTTVPIQPKQYLPGESFLYLGQAYPLEIIRDQKMKLVLDDGFKLAESIQENAELVFQNWYRQQARRVIEERVTFFADRYQFHYEKIRITSARTRWGSCSSKGTLSFSWRLIQTPLEIVDYVVIHELAHTVHHNHSEAFWKLVEKLIPEFKERRKRLREYGRDNI
jgi:predicted metal-dependent hydrolase